MNQDVPNQPTVRGKRKWLAWIGILLLLIIAVLAALPFFTPPVETLAMDAAARTGTDGAYFALSQGVVHYEASGPEGAPTVVFIHGISIPYVVWDSNFPTVADAGYRAVRYDRYGVGYSDRPRGIRYDADLYDQALLPGYVERFKGFERYKGTLNAWVSMVRHFPIQGLESSYRAVGNLQKPVLLIWGKEDRVLPFATTGKVRAAIPQVELLAVDQAGHASHYEKPGVVNEAILSFLRRIMPISRPAP